MCDPDYNVYTECENPKPEGERGNLRSCGFHLHIGYPNPNIDTSLLLIKYLDLCVGVPSVLFDKDTRRRSLYGKAGSFRLQPHGCEYRVLSGAMYSTDDRIRIVWSGIMKALSFFEHRVNLPDSNLVQRAINENDEEVAKLLINKYKLL